MGCIYRKDRIALYPFDNLLGSSADGVYDLDKYKTWMTDSEVTKFNSHGLFPKSKREIDSFGKEASSNQNQVTWKIYYNDNFIGMCSLQGIDWINRSGEVAIYIGEKSLWGKGISKTSIGFMLAHGFNRVGLNRIWSGTASTNIAMNVIFQKMGFKKEGCFRDGTFLDGNFDDVNSYGILKKDWDKKTKEL